MTGVQTCALPICFPVTINKGYDYQYRFERLLKLLYETKAILPIEYEIVYSLEEAFKHKKKISKRKLEGTVLKDPYGMWKDHTSRHQVKIKVDFECELRVISLLPGTGKNEDTFGSFLCISEDEALWVAVSGLDDEDRLKYFQNPPKIISVLFNALIDSKVSEKASLFLPRFNGERLDKDRANTLEEIQKIVEEVNYE